MEQSKFYRSLKILTVYELNRFVKFAASPYFNSNSSIDKFVTYLAHFIKTNKTDDSLLIKIHIWQNLFPEKTFNDQKFRKLLSDGLKLFESFLIQEEFEASSIVKSNYLLESIINRNLKHLHNSSLSSANRLASTEVDRSAKFFYQQYRFEKNKFGLVTDSERKQKAKSQLAAFNIKEIAKNLDLFFLAEKLRYLCTLLSWKNVIKHDVELLFMQEIINQVETLDYESVPPIAIYYQTYLSYIDSENDAHFFKLKEFIRKHINSFPLDEAKEIYGAAFNFCIRKINQGKEKFLTEILTLYEDSLHQKIIFEKGFITPSNFRSIAITGLRLGKFEWTETFIKEYEDKLEPKFRNNAVNFNLARLYFYKKEFENTILQLREVEFNDIFYDLGSKVLLLASYYEMDEIKPLYALFESFGSFLNRHKTTIPEQRRSNYLNLIKKTRKLTRIQSNDSDGYRSLLEEVQNTKHLANKDWLIEKIKEKYR